MKKSTRKPLQAVLFIVLGLVLLYIVYRANESQYIEQCQQDGIPLDECSLLGKLWTDFKSIHVSWLLIVMACFISSTISRAIRWRMLIEPLGKRPKLITLFFAVMIAQFTNLAFPRIGEFVRAGVVSRYTGISAERIMGTVVLDRIADLILFAMLLGLVFGLQSDMILGHLQSIGLLPEDFSFWQVGIVGVLLGVLGILGLRWLVTRDEMSGILGKVQRMLIGFWEGLKTISQVKQVGWFIFHSVWIWIMFFMMTYLSFRIFDPTAHLGVEAGLTVFGFGSLGFVLPSPGGMGTYHFLIIESLKLYGVAAADGFSFANIVYFTLQIGGNALLGILGFILLPIIHKHEQ